MVPCCGSPCMDLSFIVLTKGNVSEGLFFFQVKIKKGKISLVAMEKADWRVLDL